MEDIGPGDLVLVRDGEKVPVVPVTAALKKARRQSLNPCSPASPSLSKKATGDRFIGGSVNNEGVVTIEVSRKEGIRILPMSWSLSGARRRADQENRISRTGPLDGSRI